MWDYEYLLKVYSTIAPLYELIGIYTKLCIISHMVQQQYCSYAVQQILRFQQQKKVYRQLVCHHSGDFSL
jgi:hypothetical protein